MQKIIGQRPYLHTTNAAGIYQYWYSQYKERLYASFPGAVEFDPSQVQTRQNHNFQEDNEREVVTPNPGVWRKLDILALDPNNVKVLRLEEEEIENESRQLQYEIEEDNPAPEDNQRHQYYKDPEGCRHGHKGGERVDPTS